MLIRYIFHLPVPNVPSCPALIKTCPCLQEGDSSKRVQTLVVLVLSFRSSSSSSCSVRRCRLLSITVKTQYVKIIIRRGSIKLNKAVLCEHALTLRQTAGFVSHLSWCEDVLVSSSGGRWGSSVRLAGWSEQTTLFASTGIQICWCGPFAKHKNKHVNLFI